MWRHGDVFLAACSAIPADAKPLPHLILAEGEITGHAHRILERDSAELFRGADQLYLRVRGGSVTLTHEEHHAITIPQGTYRVWIQREYTPREIRRVID